MNCTVFRRLTFVFVVLALGLASQAGLAAGEKIIHVATGGDDANAGTLEKPLRTLNQAVALAGPGDTIRIRGGIYRESVEIEKNGTDSAPIRLLAYEHERVVLTGATRLEKWRRESDSAQGDRVFSAEWPYRLQGWRDGRTHPNDDYHKAIGRVEQVFFQGFMLHQVFGKGQLGRGRFHVDYEAERLYVCAPNNSDLIDDDYVVEASTRSTILECEGDYIHVRGIVFRYAANRAQQGAVRFAGDHAVVQDCVFERTNSIGADFEGQNIRVRRCVFQNNGQMGFGASGAHGLHLSDCVCRNNNTKGFDRGWEAGGNKLVRCRDVLIERSQFINNRGNGIWFDISNESCTVRNCFIADNDDAGIFYEISFGLHAHDNVIVRNGFAETPGAWGANAGICLSSSPHCVIERNLLIGNREGFAYREQERSTRRLDSRESAPVWNHDETIQNNFIAYNRAAQTWGWFDIDDNRHWPAETQETDSPATRSLETLNLSMKNNLYALHPGQQLFNWGVTWKKHKRYSSIEDVRNELDLELGSRVLDIHFKDARALDFRVEESSLPVKMDCYPRGEVPGVKIGLIK